MTSPIPLGDRMKGYEAAWRVVLPRRAYTVIRVDIRAGHSYLRGADKPFDAAFVADMNAVAEALCAEIAGARLAYTQSDEISVLATDFGSEGTQPWFGGVVAKQVSIAAAVATAALNERRPGRRVLFDARVFTLPDPVEVANYFLWRQRDAVTNSVSMTAQAHFSPRRLHGVSTAGMRELLLAEAGVDWAGFPSELRLGRVTTRHSGLRAVQYVNRRTGQQVSTTAVRSWWETSPAPEFTADPGGFLAGLIPRVPRPAV